MYILKKWHGIHTSRLGGLVTSLVSRNFSTCKQSFWDHAGLGMPMAVTSCFGKVYQVQARHAKEQLDIMDLMSSTGEFNSMESQYCMGILM